jgi:hypothetical protein
MAGDGRNGIAVPTVCAHRKRSTQIAENEAESPHVYRKPRAGPHFLCTWFDGGRSPGKDEGGRAATNYAFAHVTPVTVVVARQAAAKGYASMFRYSLLLWASLWTTAPLMAASWADTMFAELSKDFGSVPRGPTLYHAFQLANNTNQPVHIASVRVSCGCVTATAARYDLAPGDSTVIQAYMDTQRFLGSKSVTIFVTFDRPYWQEVRLVVQANSRDDVAVSPDNFTFGQLKRSNMRAVSVNVTLYGGGQWQIVDIQPESNYIQTTLKEVRRDASEVTYQVTASLRSDVPTGKWYSDVWLKTNHPMMPRVRVPLTVTIESSLSISSTTVALGKLKPGAEAERKLVVRGVKPFRITKVQGTDDQLIVKDSTSESKPVHVLTVTLKPKAEGDLNRRLKIVTDLPEEGEIEFQAQAQVAQ